MSLEANTPMRVSVRANVCQQFKCKMKKMLCGVCLCVCEANYRWELISRKTMENGRDVAKLINDAYFRFAVICVINAMALSELGINHNFSILL